MTKLKKVLTKKNPTLKHSVTVYEETLIIKVVDNRKWYQYLNFSFKIPKIIIYLPKNEYGAIKINASTGDINIPECFTFSSMNIFASTGDVTNKASVTGDIKIAVH